MTLSIVSVFRDEARYLKEWIEFHLLVGVDKFYLVNNNSVDNYLEVLTPYIDKGIVILSNMEIETLNNNKGHHNEQLLVSYWIKKLNSIVKSCTEDWITHISTDEFLFPTNKDNIKEILTEYDSNIGEVSVNWILFGNNNYTLKDGELLIEKITKSSPHDYIPNLHVKFIVRPSAVANIPSVHFVTLNPRYIKTDSKGNPNNFKSNYETSSWVGEPLMINHYRLRDLDWTEKKIKIYEHWGRNELTTTWDVHNDVENYVILRFVDKLKENIRFNSF